MAKKKSTRKPKRRGANTRPKKNTGVSLELAVARIQQMLDPKSKVTHNERLTDRVGNERQFDVVIRGTFGGQPVLGVAECKDHGKKKGPSAVEAFSKKTENLGANLRLMVSRLGFTKQAIVLAKHEHITCLSLIPADLTQTGLNLSATWYAQVWQWKIESIRLTIHWPGSAPHVPTFDAQEVLYDNKPILYWFLRELQTTKAQHYSEESISVDVAFDQPRALTIAGRSYEAAGVTFQVQRQCKHFRKVVSFYGDAVYDWQTKRCTIPAGGKVYSSVIDTQFEDFEEYDGKKSKESQFLIEITIIAHKPRFNLPEDIVDIAAL